MVGQLRAAGLIVFRQISRGSPFEYLLLQTSYGEHHWTPPKGHVDPGESDRETAVRETQEEAGLGPSDYTIVENFKHTISYKVKGRDKTVCYWVARLNDFDYTIKLSREHQDFKWLELKAACEFVGYDDMQSTLTKADEFLKEL